MEALQIEVSSGNPLELSGSFRLSPRSSKDAMSIDVEQQQQLSTPISSSSVYRVGTLGQGSTSKVYKAIILSKLSCTAEKVFVVFDPVKRIQLFRELEALKSIFPQEAGSESGSAYIVRPFEVFANPVDETLSLCLEYMDSGSLEDVVQAGGCRDERVLASIAYQMTQGLRFLHGKRLIHRDVKPSNVLMSLTGCVKLADFGLARTLESGHSLATSFVGTFLYMAPERLIGEGYSFSSDLWSLGLTVLAVAMGRYPYPSAARKGYWELLQATQLGPPPVPDGFSGEMKALLWVSCQQEASNRASAETLLSEPFLHGAAESIPAQAMEVLAGKISSPVAQGVRMPNSPGAEGSAVLVRESLSCSKIPSQKESDAQGAPKRPYGSAKVRSGNTATAVSNGMASSHKRSTSRTKERLALPMAQLGSQKALGKVGNVVPTPRAHTHPTPRAPRLPEPAVAAVRVRRRTLDGMADGTAKESSGARVGDASSGLSRTRQAVISNRTRNSGVRTRSAKPSLGGKITAPSSSTRSAAGQQPTQGPTPSALAAIPAEAKAKSEAAEVKAEVGAEEAEAFKGSVDVKPTAIFLTPKPKTAVTPPARHKFPDSKVADLVLAWRSHILKRSLPELVPSLTQQPAMVSSPVVVTEQVVAELAAALKCSGAILHARLAEAIAFLDCNRAGAVVGVLGSGGAERVVSDFELAALQEHRSQYTPAAAERHFDTILGAMEYQRSVSAMKSAMAERVASRGSRWPDVQGDTEWEAAVEETRTEADADTEAELEELFPLHPYGPPLSPFPDAFEPRTISAYSERTVESRSSCETVTHDFFRSTFSDSKDPLDGPNRPNGPSPLFHLELKDSREDDVLDSAHCGLEGEEEVVEEEGLGAHFDAIKGGKAACRVESPHEPDESPFFPELERVYDEESFEDYAED
mmetsp:Transcript_16592/g.36779  ORF Transcript_16592/g.36779 Transcript_16592/m.36779 type:complete len:923 (-) Transcript_16592:89-2857(-)